MTCDRLCDGDCPMAGCVGAGALSPNHMSDSLQVLTATVTRLMLLPLDEMADYCEQVEHLGESNPAFTDERRATTAHVARMVAAAQHLRQTVAMGGA